MAQNKALSLDGDRDYVEVVSNKSLNISEHITMQAWVKFKDLDGQIFSKSPCYQLFLLGRKIEAEVFKNGESHKPRNVEGGTILVTGRCHRNQ